MSTFTIVCIALAVVALIAMGWFAYYKQHHSKPSEAGE